MINKLTDYSKKYGYLLTCKKIIQFSFVILKNKVVDFFGRFSVNSIIHKRRIKLSDDLSKKMDNTVRYGPFKGFLLGKGFEWSKADIGNMLLGLYEKEVLQAICEVSNNRKVLIDLGAADGYFAIGCLISNMFNNVYCYELSEKSRKNLFNNAVLNRVQDRIEITGIATNSFPVELQKKGVDFSQSVVLCDIEGGEFELFDDNVLNALKDTIIIIEIHDWHKDGASRYKKLQERAVKYFNITKLTTRSRDLSLFPELAHLSDDDRWLVCSEGRHYLTTWLKLDPK